MVNSDRQERLAQLKNQYPQKFASNSEIFSHIHRGDRLFISTACGEPQYLVQELVNYVQAHPKSLFDAEVLQVWTLGLAPYTDSKFAKNFRHNSFFIGHHTRSAVNEGLADYTPIFLSQVPGLFEQGFVPIDVALIQTSYPDDHGYVNLGVSVDIVKAAVEQASLVIAQMNSKVPRIHGDGFIALEKLDYIIAHDEPLLEYQMERDNILAGRIGKYVASLIQDGDTIQVGYGSIPDAMLSYLSNKKNLGVHTELISDGLVQLLKSGAVNNSQKTRNRGKVVATFCMGSRDTYDYLNDNPAVEFRTVDYTNHPITIANHNNMVAINSALEIDLTGQSTAESLGSNFYSGIGGQADFMRGAVMAKGGRTILALESTAENDTISRIVPFLREGVGITLNRGDIHYVVTEYGIAYLHGKNIRERAMQLTAIAHPKFRPWLIEQAKKHHLIYADQAFITGQQGEYPEHLETYRTTRTGLELWLRPVKFNDEPNLKNFFYALSDESLVRRFMSVRTDMPHQRLQQFSVINYNEEIIILAIVKQQHQEVIVGVGQYALNEDSHTAEVAFVVRDDYHKQGIGTLLLNYLTQLAKKQGLLGFTADVLLENRAMLHLFEKMNFRLERRMSEGVYALKMFFN
ncbi:GNAT family N-acetyltransferase [Synechocystis sp. PCC 7339]|uniref:GNAT family N-acetyltransferase n=1 Tax=unclassified Synechocystis TaxID=2640012 RepID=UPI001BAF626E|nr:MULTISPECIES: GNAT family N-acetyltransferase [unclassified Synechocystis]QUS61745.1 GNAT family N-acetyltransferase [Synechocystis sp. PCC 7338]UAJ73943.1 GNAT family N-acetyltransferase [Synechocystis sp. PCC 7339]